MPEPAANGVKQSAGNGAGAITLYHAAYYAHERTRRSASAGRVLTINGTNADDRSGAVYKEWLRHHAGELGEHFRDRADVLLTTEAAEDITLQFCSLVVNYDDLPWSPQRLKVELEEGTAYLKGAERWLWELTRHELTGYATFDARDCTFDLAPLGPGWPGSIPTGRYRFVTRREPGEGQHAYRLGHPLAQAVVDRARARPLRTARVRFDYSGHRAKVGAAANLAQNVVLLGLG